MLLQFSLGIDMAVLACQRRPPDETQEVPNRASRESARTYLKRKLCIAFEPSHHLTLRFDSECSIWKGGGIMLRLIFTLLAITLLGATACTPMPDVTPKDTLSMDYNTRNNGGGS
jgi:hypothetical protein